MVELEDEVVDTITKDMIPDNVIAGGGSRQGVEYVTLLALAAMIFVWKGA
ncbi:MAG: hypothetical protein QM744_14880 [Mesorhizobium sp.]